MKTRIALKILAAIVLVMILTLLTTTKVDFVYTGF